MQDEASAALRVGPALGGAGLAGVTLNEWVAIITILYVLAQIGLLIPRYWVMYRRWRTAKHPAVTKVTNSAPSA